MTIKRKSGKAADISLGSIVSSACKRITRLFDLSTTAALTRFLKSSFLCLSLRTVGVFLVTLGMYAFIISTILTLFTDRSTDPSGIYGGLLCAVCSLPLLFSRGNVSTVLINSNLGNFLCHQLSIRKEALPLDPVVNNLSAAFVAGIAVSLAVFIFPFSYVVVAIAVFIIALTIIRSPETGLTFFIAFLFLANSALQYLILSVTLLSYALKVIRGKRRVSVKKTDLILPVFAICTIGAMISSSQTAVDLRSIKYAFLLLPYLLAVCLLRDCRNIKSLMALSVILGGTLSSVYLLGFALDSVIPRDVAVDPAFLLDAVLGLPAFESGFAPLFCATLIPVSIAFVMKPHSEGNRLTTFLCFVSMLSALIISENVAYTTAAVISSVILILMAGNRKLYFFLSVLLSATVITSFAGSFGEKLYGYIFSNITEAYAESVKVFSAGDDGILSQFVFCGQGFNEKALGSSFFYSIFSQLGLCGIIIIAALLISLLLKAAALIARTYRSSSYKESIRRFHAIADPAELRMGAVAMICSVISILICSTFTDLYVASSSYAWIFMICGICSAYSSGANLSIDKAQSAISSDDCSERSAVILSKSSSDV